ncbi:hypothetical protein F5976_08300 [Lacticaseibacillus rhamnosus]|nr:hypothetical protein F5976_08300 [Lacticaseibacillus rhamnosus]QFV11201.1 hypothetical protein GEK51_10585 [Lacticaseibacillus rhamnosus]
MFDFTKFSRLIPLQQPGTNVLSQVKKVYPQVIPSLVDNLLTPGNLSYEQYPQSYPQVRASFYAKVTHS